MVEFTFPSGRTGWVSGVSGTVIDSKQWSETYVSSTPGSSNYNHSTGQIDIRQPTISSHTVERGRVWVRTDQGKDVEITVPISATQGQKVVVLWGNADKDNKKGPYLYWWNKNSGKHGLLLEEDASDRPFLLTPEEARRQWWTLIIIIICVTLFSIISMPFLAGIDPDDKSGISFAHILGGVLGVIGGFFLAAIIDIINAKKRLIKVFRPRREQMLQSLSKLADQNKSEW